VRPLRWACGVRSPQAGDHRSGLGVEVGVVAELRSVLLAILRQRDVQVDVGGTAGGTITTQRREYETLTGESRSARTGGGLILDRGAVVHTHAEMREHGAACDYQPFDVSDVACRGEGGGGDGPLGLERANLLLALVRQLAAGVRRLARILVRLLVRLALVDTALSGLHLRAEPLDVLTAVARGGQVAGSTVGPSQAKASA
jgi:hypothetical protein